jgi:hypothetical protein
VLRVLCGPTGLSGLCVVCVRLATCDLRTFACGSELLNHRE